MIKRLVEAYHHYLEVHRMRPSHFWFIVINFIIVFTLVGIYLASPGLQQ